MRTRLAFALAALDSWLHGRDPGTTAAYLRRARTP